MTDNALSLVRLGAKKKSFTFFPIPSGLHTKDVKHFTCLSERALDLL